MVLGQYMAILANIWWYWVIISLYCLVLGGTGSVLYRAFMPVYVKQWRFVPVLLIRHRQTDRQTHRQKCCASQLKFKV